MATRNVLFLKRSLNSSVVLYSSTNRRVLASASLRLSPSSRRYAASKPFNENQAEFAEFSRTDRKMSYGLSSALAGRGVIVKDKVFHNLKPSELRQKGATVSDSFSGLPVHIRGDILGGSSEISKAQFSKLLKQVTAHISSISEIFVNDGAIGSSSRCDAKVRIISDNGSAALSLSTILWGTPTRAVSHDSRPLVVYAATTISSHAAEGLGLGARGNNGFVAADVEHSSLILCGKAFTDAKRIKQTLAALSAPIMSARGGLPLSARLLVSEDSVFLLFSPTNIFRSCSDLLVSDDTGVILSSEGVSPLFQIRNSDGPLLKAPSAIICLCSDSSGTFPSATKLSHGQAAYHFLAGYQNGSFFPAYSKGLSSIDPLDLAKAFLSKIKENQIPSFLVNVDRGENQITGKDLITVVKSVTSQNIPAFRPKGGDLQRKYRSFLSSKFH